MITLFQRRFKTRASHHAPFLLWSYTLLIVTLFGQLLIWIFGNRYPNYPLVEYFFVPALMLALIRPGNEPEKNVSFLFVLLPLNAFIGIVFMTNHPLLVSAPFLGICAGDPPLI